MSRLTHHSFVGESKFSYPLNWEVFHNVDNSIRKLGDNRSNIVKCPYGKKGYKMSKLSDVFQEFDRQATREFENYVKSLEENSSKILETAAISVLGLLGAVTLFLIFIG